ncbi:Hypothetical predicted protein [Xyrichtys novacula]|uniref:Uncharacterized protein n=1 Tax=Xyrichtys novacula TaxID=13765 RepID=A0AAV1HN64_XYRNO|nr:Hypothetical predicted protein [Xyrichtys novacula]
MRMKSEEGRESESLMSKRAQRENLRLSWQAAAGPDKITADKGGKEEKGNEEAEVEEGGEGIRGALEEHTAVDSAAPFTVGAVNPIMPTVWPMKAHKQYILTNRYYSPPTPTVYIYRNIYTLPAYTQTHTCEDSSS